MSCAGILGRSHPATFNLKCALLGWRAVRRGHGGLARGGNAASGHTEPDTPRGCVCLIGRERRNTNPECSENTISCCLLERMIAARKTRYGALFM